uniref:Uncharacterized protein n=1 Tax=Arundo donax TaxID=35708 RepID=A0A0A9DS00_ARUDO
MNQLHISPKYDSLMLYCAASLLLKVQ